MITLCLNWTVCSSQDTGVFIPEKVARQVAKDLVRLDYLDSLTYLQKLEIKMLNGVVAFQDTTIQKMKQTDIQKDQLIENVFEQKHLAEDQIKKYRKSNKWLRLQRDVLGILAVCLTVIVLVK